MRNAQPEYRWRDIWIIGRMLGVRSPKYRLNQAMEAKVVKQPRRGRYRIKRKRVRSWLRKGRAS